MMDAGLLEAVQRESHVRIDLTRYAQNILALKSLAGPGHELMAVVKADAYGHGAAVCGKVALENGATQLAVARIWEAMHLRKSGISAPILVLGGPNLSTLQLAVDHDLILTVGSESAASAVEAASFESERPLRVHLKLDTGLHRYGLRPEIARALIRRLADNPGVALEGVYAHFSSADETEPGPTFEQIESAHQFLDDIEHDGIHVKYIHLPNSAATIAGMSGRSNLVRAGIASYGLAPSEDVSLPQGVHPVLSVHSTLTRVFELRPGEGVSYGLTYRANSTETCGTIPIGYADGLPRSLSDAGWFVYAGVRCPIRGRVCMDQTVAGVPDTAHENASVLVIGEEDSGAMSLDTVARLDGTINYEIATRLSARMPRVYVENGAPVAVDFPSTSAIGH